MTARVVGSITPIDPSDVFVISGWASQKGYVVDEVWKRHEQTHAALSPRHRDAFSPPDVTVVRFDRETTTCTEVAWMDGTHGAFEPKYLDPLCSVCRRYHPEDGRHPCE